MTKYKAEEKSRATAAWAEGRRVSFLVVKCYKTLLLCFFSLVKPGLHLLTSV